MRGTLLNRTIGRVGIAVALGAVAGLWGCSHEKKMADRPSADQLPSVQELPNPFIRDDGSTVRTAGEWEKHRKELAAPVMYYEYGRMPAYKGRVKATELESTTDPETGATERHLLLAMGPGGKVETHLILTVPEGKGPFPAIITGDLCWGSVKPAIVAEVVKRGYVLAQFDRTQIAPDKNVRNTGVYTLFPEYDWGALAAWAWGYHRVVDYLLTLDEVDGKHIAVTGHSRGGKATLLAGALDTRIALTAPNNSGCGGAGCYKFQAPKSEDIAAILKNFPYWFGPHFPQFIGRVDRLPFDQHWVKALVAPRALLSTEALGDLWANPEGTQQTYLAAKEVYKFLGVPERIGIHYRQGTHEQNADDWNVLLDFADWQFFGKKTDRKFDTLAFPDSPKRFSWEAPKVAE